MAFIVNTIIDPDDINTTWTAGTGNLDGHYYTDEIHINAVDKTFHFKGGSNMDTSGDGITGQALYSFFKDRWQDTAAITKFDFPMLSITNEQFEFVDAWVPDDGASVDLTDLTFADANPDTITTTGGDFTLYFRVGDTLDVIGSGSNDGTYTIDAVTTSTITVIATDVLVAEGTADASATLTGNLVTQGIFTTTTSKLIRTAGWSEVLANGTVNKRVSGIVSLGALVDNTDQPYFAQDSSFIAGTTNTEYTGPVNESVRIFSQVVGVTDIEFTTTAILSTGSRLDVFSVGDVITVTGTTLNNTTYTVDAIVSPFELTITGGVAEPGQSATMVTDLRSYFKMFVRERGKIYADSNLLDIGVTTMTYIVYRFPVSNATDLNLATTNDTEISSAGVPADVSPYDVVSIVYLPNPQTTTGVVNITGDWATGFTYALGDVAYDLGDSQGDGDARWYYVSATTGVSTGGDLAADTGNTWTLWDKLSGGGERWVNDGYYAYSVIIDANNTVSAGDTKADSPYTHASGGTKENIYDWAQWSLRQVEPIDETALTRNGNVTNLLAGFVGATLETTSGVFIDDLSPVDTNAVKLYDYVGTSRSYPLVVTVTINFNNNLSDNTGSTNISKFYAYYKDPDGVVNGNEFGTVGALQVVKSPSGSVGVELTNLVPESTTGSSYQFSYAYDGDTTGGRTVSTPTDIVVVAIGLSTGQYVQAEGTITTSGATVSLVAPLERNYSNPA